MGIGWNYVEFEALDKDFKNRARRFEEQIALIRKLTSEPIVTFEGKYERVHSAGLNPLPIQRPLPIWIGAGVEAGLKRAAELGDGFFPGDPLEGGWAATLDRMHGWAEAAGRDWSKFGISASVNAGKGTPDDWVKEAEEWRALGATHLSISTTGGHLPSPDGHIRRLREAKDALGVGQSHDG